MRLPGPQRFGDATKTIKSRKTTNITKIKKLNQANKINKQTLKRFDSKSSIQHKCCSLYVGTWVILCDLLLVLFSFVGLPSPQQGRLGSHVSAA